MSVSPIIAYGFGSWGSVNKLPTLGFTPSLVVYTSVWMNVLTTIVSEIKTLGLTDMPTDNVKVVKVPVYRPNTDAQPGVFVYPLDDVESGGTNLRDDLIYRCGISIFQKSDRDRETDLDRLLTWRENIRRHFIHQRLTGVASVYMIRFETRPALDPGQWDNHWDVSTLVLRVISRETRG